MKMLVGVCALMLGRFPTAARDDMALLQAGASAQLPGPWLSQDRRCSAAANPSVAGDAELFFAVLAIPGSRRHGSGHQAGGTIPLGGQKGTHPASPYEKNRDVGYADSHVA